MSLFDITIMIKTGVKLIINCIKTYFRVFKKMYNKLCQLWIHYSCIISFENNIYTLLYI